MKEEELAHKMRLLVIDGDLAGCDRLCSGLAPAGWRINLAADEIEAFSAVRARQVDLVLVHLSVDEAADMDLPNILREVSSAPYLPVVILAADPSERQRCRLLDCGADEVISDETSADEMISRIGAILRIKNLHDQLAASRSELEDALHRERRLLEKLRKDNANLQEQATTDPLTRVQNVRSFRDILRHEFRIARRYDQSLSLLVLDVDHFKVVNDTHGHPSGDYVLKELAVILKQNVRASDVVARTGGEEFNVILPRADRGQAAALAERIRREIYERRFVVYGRDIHVTTSIGSATYPADAEITDEEMLAYFADQALLEAKEAGRDRVVAVCELSQHVRRRLRRQYTAMRHASEEEKICDPAGRLAEID